MIQPIVAMMSVRNPEALVFLSNKSDKPTKMPIKLAKKIKENKTINILLYFNSNNASTKTNNKGNYTTNHDFNS